MRDDSSLEESVGDEAENGTSPEVGEETNTEAAEAAGEVIAAALTQAPASVRNTPEYKELQKTHRQAVRDLGRANAELATARTEAERVRLAAEAERQAVLEQQLADTLGEDGIAAFNELAELSQTNPVEAARKFAALMARTQSAPPAEPAAAEPEATTEAPVTEPNAAVPPPPGAVDGSAPLQPPTEADSLEAITGPLDKRYMDTVDRNLTLSQRNRVTMRERGDALIGYLASSYLKTPEIASRVLARMRTQR